MFKEASIISKKIWFYTKCKRQKEDKGRVAGYQSAFITGGLVASRKCA